MKRLFLFGMAILVAGSLLSFFVKNDTEAEDKIAEGAESPPNAALINKLLTEPLTKEPVKVKWDRPGRANILLKSDDGGKTWQDVSEGLPDIDQPVKFYAGGPDLYLHVKDVLYRSKGNLKTPVWEKEDIPNLENPSNKPSTAIVFNHSGAMAFNFSGEIHQKANNTKNWLPMDSNFKKNKLVSVFETSDGTLLFSYPDGLYKSSDKGKTREQIQKNPVMHIAESEGVLVATDAKGIIRSTDNGKHWQRAISKGGVGIAVESIKGGFAAICYNGTTQSRAIHISLDKGKTWQAIDKGLPPSSFISSIKQVGNYLVCGHPDGIFRSTDMGKTWNRVYPGIDEYLFGIYVSGNVLYAVAGGRGC